MEPEGPTKERGSTEHSADNVIRLPKEWVGPHDEPSMVEAPPAVSSPRDPPEDGQGSEPVGSVREWLGGDDELVQIGGLTGDAFWGGGTVSEQPDADESQDETVADRAERVGRVAKLIHGVGGISPRLTGGIVKWIGTAVALLLLAVVAVPALIGSVSGTQKTRPAASATGALARAPQTGISGVRPMRRHAIRHRRSSPGKHKPVPPKTVEATYAPAPSGAPATPASSAAATSGSSSTDSGSSAGGSSSGVGGGSSSGGSSSGGGGGGSGGSAGPSGPLGPGTSPSG